MASTFAHTFFLTLGGFGLLLALAALLFAIVQLRARSAPRSEVLVQSPREKLLHLENIALRRRLGWLEQRLTTPTSAFAPGAPTVEHPAAAPGSHRYE